MINKPEQKLDDALEGGQGAGDCNEPEIQALLKAGEQIKASAFNTPPFDPYFKDNLKQKILAKRREKTTMTEKIADFLFRFKSALSPRRLIPAVSLLVLIAIIAAIINFWPQAGREFSRLAIKPAYAQDNFDVAATLSDAAGVDSSTAFTIKSKQAITDAVELKDNIKIIPEVEFDLNKINDHEFKVVPKTGLEDRKVYRLLIVSSYINDNGLEADRNFSWAFQVKDQFKILHTLPADKGTGVPVASGIEIAFSNDNFTNFESSFSLEPKAEGRFEKHGRTAVFVPLKPLSAGKIYTVKIAPAVGIEGSSEKLAAEYSFQFETAFDRPVQPQAYISFMNDKYEFGTKQTPTFSVYLNSSYTSRQVSVNLYNYPTRQSFVNELKKIYDLPAWSDYRGQLSKQHDTAGLAKTAAYELSIQKNDYDNVLVLPQTLPAGFYLLEAKLDDATSFVMLQVADVSAYVQVNKNKILFWTNLIGSTEPLAGASVADIKSNQSATTDQSGVAVFPNPDPEKYQVSYYAVSSGGQSLIIPVYLNDPGLDQPNNRFWNYFYADRALYKPTDQVNFWGFIKPRLKSAAGPEEVTVRLEKNNFFDYYNEPIAVTEEKIKLGSDGFFTGQIKFANLTPAYYRLTVNIAGEKLSLYSRYLEVKAYQKPAYEIIVTPKKSILNAGEPAVYDIKTAFFDGTPVANIELNYNHNGLTGAREEATVKTDEFGRANLSFSTTWPNCQEYCDYSRTDDLSLTPVRGEFGGITGQGIVTVLGPKIKFIKTEAKTINSSTAQIGAEIRLIDINNEQDNYNGAPAANIKITAKVSQTEYIATPVGNYYDFINKVSYPTYNYTEKITELPELALITDDKGLAQAQFKIEDDKTYSVKFYAQDETGKIITGYGYVYNSRGYGDDPRYENYFLRAKDSHDSYYKIGENVSLELIKNKQAVAGGQTLFTRQQLGLVDYQLKNNGNYDFIFEDRFVPNLAVYAVWFDGNSYHEGGGFYASIKPEARRLNIDIKADKAKYAPAGEATLDIKVTDPSGQGVSSEVNLNIVDQAFLKLGGGADASPLNILSPVDSGLWYSLYSHRFPTGLGGAEKGGGGGEARSLFPDVALFRSVKTDSGGRVQIKFKLPDSVTGWAVTAQAISDNLYAGSGSAVIKASLPFFVQPLVAEEYLSSDRPVVRLNAYGDSLKTNDQVVAGFEAKSLQIAKTEQTVPAFTSVYFNLDKLAAGLHDLIFSGKFQKENDSVLKKIKVMDSRLAEIKKDFYELKPGTKISGARDGWTTLIFMDYGRGRLYNDVAELLYSYGSRVDQKIAKLAGYKLMKDNFSDAEQSGEPAFDSRSYQDQGGGIKLLPYSDPDLELSAKIAGFAPDIFDRASLTGYFYNILNSKDSNREEAILAIYGLASLNEPVLLMINEYAKMTDLKPQDKIYLALAALNIGDETTARRLYSDIQTAYGEESKPYSRIKFDNKNNDNNIRATALVAILAAGLGDEKSQEYWRYAVDNRPADWLLNLEEIGYLTKLLPNLPAGETKFTLKINGKQVEKTLKRWETYTVMVDNQGLSNLAFSILSGKAGVISQYRAATAQLANSKYISVDKKYFVGGKETSQFKEGDIVEVRLYPKLGAQALIGSYQVTDILPSGLESITNLYSYGLDYGCSTWYPREASGQSLNFSLWSSWEKYSCNRGEYFRYYAYAVAPGSYTVEPALIQSEKSDQVKSYSAYGKITITK